jgi:alpha-mannosidase II
VLDNRGVLNIFKLVLESREACKKSEDQYPAGYLTSTAYLEQKKLLHPFEKLIFNENDWNGVRHSFGNDHEDQDVGFEIVAMRNLPHIRTNSLGLVIHRTNLDKCSIDASINSNQINLKRLLGLDENEDTREIFRAPITLLEAKEKVNDESISMCAMDVKGFILK